MLYLYIAIGVAAVAIVATLHVLGLTTRKLRAEQRKLRAEQRQSAYLRGVICWLEHERQILRDSTEQLIANHRAVLGKGSVDAHAFDDARSFEHALDVMWRQSGSSASCKNSVESLYSYAMFRYSHLCRLREQNAREATDV